MSYTGNFTGALNVLNVPIPLIKGESIDVVPATVETENKSDAGLL